ncbi:hypothetical protein RHSIM_Rhsim02G0208200 [Rhododendron simsii]|uniref:CHD3-type chromatin-remodeling factor PICKLE n=1 Tax=Rhododendron simsii TaxID=118357 RepID=A0A834LXD5_RHOSS|nr:hypothetical protein RHSIM_Rhsim02G0208200 [Rhododendron simsii]
MLSFPRDKMSSLVERLRVRSDRKPVYNIDDWDDGEDLDLKRPGSGLDQQKIERIVRDDAACPLNDIEKILDCEMRPTAADDSDASKQIFMKQYLVKWKGLSYLHCTWVSEKEFVKAYKALPRLRTKVNNFHRQMSSINNSEDEFVAIRPEWTTVDRILACRGGDDDEKEYLVKWKELSYDECYWEFESDISSFQQEIERFYKIQSRRRKHSSSKQKSNTRDATESKKKQKEFQQFEHSPGFLSGGSLHPYQLEGLNFLRFSWSKQTHVILADEMGLGKTIQSIAFLASLFEDSLCPHIVVAPLSTLRNWEREFALWAPQMNVVMYVGSAQARAVIREHEFYFPKRKMKKKNGQSVGESKQDRIKFDVLLTSYEVVNLDTTALKPIQWECMIVDEGHRLKNKDSKLFSSLKQYSSKHRVLLTGTPLQVNYCNFLIGMLTWNRLKIDPNELQKAAEMVICTIHVVLHILSLCDPSVDVFQNNLDELFMLMHFLDAGKFGSLEEFQEEFKDINQEEQISRLHKMLAPHLLRRVKKDVMKELPPKKELILRVDLSSKQKEYYKAILTRNYEILTRKGGAQISLINVVMELRKLCCHPYMLEGVEPEIEDPNESFKQLLESAGKLNLLDKMMVKLREQGHRVLIYSQFQHMLDLLEDYCRYKKWQYERIDGKVGGAERQIRIDRFNAKNSSRFCFLLSTRAGGLGINLATADTVIIYDSDWNPHADLQAMARAHRLGQTNKVMIFRLITRGTIEERMMQMTKKKMVLEHLVVGRLKAQNINQEELDDIIRYGSKELFADENDEVGKSRQIHYDDAAINRLLDREQVGDEEANLDDAEEDGFLKAFKVANFEYIDEVQAAAEEQARKASIENTTTYSERANYWEDLLKDKYEVNKVEEFNAMGKGKRSRKQRITYETLLHLVMYYDMVSVEEDDLAGLEDVSSDGEDDNYEAELTDGETTSTGLPTGRRPYRKKARVNSAEPLPLMEGEGRSFRVLGFNQNQRAAFVQILMRFGVGQYDWAEFTPRMKQKTYEEIKEYGTLFLSHIAEDITDSPTFSDGVPKEGLRILDVLVRLAELMMIRDKVKFAAENPSSPLFADDVVSRLPTLKSGRFWKEHHDLLLLRAVLKHGYGRWQAIVDDKDLRVQEIICQELNLPFITLPVPGASQAQDAANIAATETPANQTKETGGGTDLAAEAAQGAPDAPNRTQLYPDSNTLYHFREMQRRQVEFVKKRVLLLEKALNAELQKEAFGQENTNENAGGEPEAEVRVVDIPSPSSAEIDAKTSNHLPQVDVITPEEVSVAVCDDNPDRVEMAQLYNKMCKVVGENKDSVVENLANEPAGFQERKNLIPLETICNGINRILSPVQQNCSSSQERKPNADSQLEEPNKIAGDDQTPCPEATTDFKVSTTESGHQTDSCPPRSEAPSSPTNGAGDDLEMEEKQEDAYSSADGSTDESTGK